MRSWYGISRCVLFSLISVTVLVPYPHSTGILQTNIPCLHGTASSTVSIHQTDSCIACQSTPPPESCLTLGKRRNLAVLGSYRILQKVREVCREKLHDGGAVACCEWPFCCVVFRQ